ncbi:MAG: heme-binding protein [Pseudomonadota bacterium]
MAHLTLAQANTIIENALKKGEAMGLKPLTVAVLDAGGHLKALGRADGASNLRAEMAMGKANGCIALGVGGRWINQNALDRPHFITGLVGLTGGKVLPVPGGVLIKDGEETIGAVGITGDTSDNDETCAIAGIEAAGLAAQTD